MRTYWERRTFRNDSVRAGFGLVEIIIASALFLILLLGATAASRIAVMTVREANFRLRAAFLAEEGIEAVRSIRDRGWIANIEPLENGRNYYPVFEAGTWTLATSAPPLIDGVFERRVEFGEVWRDGNDDIVLSGGSVDPQSRSVISVVRWVTARGTASTSIATYVTNFFQ